MAFVARLVAYAADALGLDALRADPSGRGEVPDERLAAAALLVHVARADGVVAPAERERLARLLGPLFEVGPERVEGLIRRATALDDELRDLGALVDEVGHLGEGERGRLLAMAYAVAIADGHLHEFEDDLVWRLGRLLGFDEAEIVAARDGAILALRTGDAE